VLITEVNEILEKVAKGELTTEDAQKILGTYKDEELGKELRNIPGKEQLEIFAIVLILFIYLWNPRRLGPTILIIYNCNGISDSRAYD
jgi:hypothetical protein